VHHLANIADRTGSIPGANAVRARARTDLAAQNASIQSDNFVLQGRPNIKKGGNVWTGDAIYVMSAAIARGRKTMSSKVTVETCQENRIPTV